MVTYFILYAGLISVSASVIDFKKALGKMNCYILFVCRNLTAPMAALSSTLSLANGDAAPRYGQLVLPTVEANFGPSYFARLVRLK